MIEVFVVYIQTTCSNLQLLFVREKNPRVVLLLFQPMASAPPMDAPPAYNSVMAAPGPIDLNPIMSIQLNFKATVGRGEKGGMGERDIGFCKFFSFFFLFFIYRI